MIGTDAPINTKLKLIGQAENWEISRERNEFNGLALLKDELSHREIKRQLRHDLTNHAKYRIK